MMVLHVVAASRCRKMKLVAWNIQASSGCGERTVEFIVGIFHAILGEYRLQTTLVKRSVMSDKWKSLYQRLYLRPYFRKGGLTVRVLASETVYFGCPICIIVGRRLNEGVEFIDYLTSSHHHNANAAYA